MSTVTISAEAAPRPPRSRFLAAFLSLVAPGVGHLYVGQPRRALIIVTINLVFGALCIVSYYLVQREFTPVAVAAGVALLLTMIYWLYAMIDAARLARRADASPPMRWYVVIAAILGFWGANVALDAMTPQVTVSAYWDCQGSFGNFHDCRRVR